MKNLTFVFLIFALFSPVSAQPAKADFDAGCQFYRKGEYDKALEKFKSVEKSCPSGGLFFNIGNTYFRLGKIGMSLVYYERAKKIAPSEDIYYNIKFVSNMINDPDYGRTFFSGINTSVLKLLFAVTMLFFSSVISLKLIFSQKKIFWAFTISGLLFISVSALYFIKYKEDSRSYAVVVDNSAEVRSGPDYSFKVNFTLPEGKKVIVFGKSDKWIEIGIKSLGIRGWVEINHFEFI